MKMKTFIGALLVGGTALGAGMLALPVATAGGGLISTWMIYVLSWAFSVATGLLFVEVGLWLPRKANIVTMAETILGGWGKWFAWALYIFLFYSLNVAYVAGGGHIVSTFFGTGQESTFGIIIFTAVFGVFVYAGTYAAGRVNALLMAGLVLSYLGFVILGVGKIQFSLFDIWGWKGAVLGLPVIFTSFSYQGVIPSLLEFLDRNVRATRLAIISGTAIPFIAYLIWDLIIKGIVPVDGNHGLLSAQAAGGSAVEPLKYFLQSQSVIVIGNLFAFFALTTSFIGVTLGLLDFLIDSLKLEGTWKSKGVLSCFIYIPPVIIALINPNVFLSALGYAGGFGCALLLGFLPALMVWVGRYKKHPHHKEQLVPGGKWVLALLFAFVLFEIVVEIIREFS